MKRFPQLPSHRSLLKSIAIAIYAVWQRNIPHTDSIRIKDMERRRITRPYGNTACRRSTGGHFAISAGKSAIFLFLERRFSVETGSRYFFFAPAPVDDVFKMDYYPRTMAGVPVKHHTHGKTGRRRSHLAMKKERLMVCGNCGAPKMAHRVCAQCGKNVKIEKK